MTLWSLSNRLCTSPWEQERFTELVYDKRPVAETDRYIARLNLQAFYTPIETPV